MKQLIKLGIYICIICNWLLFIYTVNTGDTEFLYLIWPLLVIGIGLIWWQDKFNGESENE
jgi:EamA domain-containing membrane protein RarD